MYLSKEHRDILKEMTKQGKVPPMFWGRRNYGRGQMEFIKKVYLQHYLNNYAPDGYKILYVNYKKLNYTYIHRKPKQLNVRPNIWRQEYLCEFKGEKKK